MRKLSLTNAIKSVVQAGSIRKAAESLGIPKSTLSDWLTESKKNKHVCNTYVITCVQNATDINTDFLDALHTYCKKEEAELLVIPFTYGHVSDETNWYDSQVEPFLLNNEKILNKNLRIMAHYQTVPTAVNPLGGTTVGTITQDSSGIFPHPQISMRTVPTPHCKLPKVLITTGALTVPNYTHTKAGYNGEFNHTYGALTVTVRGDQFHMRHLLCDNDGSFYDLDTKYMADGTFKGRQKALALVTGDEHIDFIDPQVVKATYTDSESICNICKPAKIFRHDVLDFYSRNHHHKFNFITNYVKAMTARDDGDKVMNVEAEMKRCIKFINKTTPEGSMSYIIGSNHNDALSRWLDEADFRADPQNAKIFLELNLARLENARLTDSGTTTVDPLEYWARGKTDAIFLKRDESFRVSGIEMSYHGDRGCNGARGSATGFAQIGTRSIIGHSHTPQINKGVYQVGTSSRLKLEYNSGPSSWLNTHCLVYPNGKRTLINIIEGDWK